MLHSTFMCILHDCMLDSWYPYIFPDNWSSKSIYGNPQKILGLRKPSQCIKILPLLLAIKPSAIGGTLFVYYCSGFIFIQNQFSLVAVKPLFEKYLLRAIWFSALSYNCSNGIFASQAFKDDCSAKVQTISFSGSGAHDQNVVAEYSIHTVVS